MIRANGSPGIMEIIMEHTFSSISALLAQRAEDVCRHLLPDGKREGHEWHCGSLGGEPGTSLKVELTNLFAGKWVDWATGQKGDLLDLFKLAQNRYISTQEAFYEATRYLCISLPNIAPVKRNFERPVLASKPIQGMTRVEQYLTTIRKLHPKTLIDFGVQDKNGEIAFNYFRVGQLIAAKYQALHLNDKGKKIITSEKDCEPCLFGWDALPKDSRFVVLTEGEIDAMTLHQYGYPSLSVPSGATGLTWIEYEYDRLMAYDEIYICFDDDEPGQKGALELVKRLGIHRCKVVTLPFKDANECLKNGLTKSEIDFCFKDAKSFHPQELRQLAEFMDAVEERLCNPNFREKGIRAPWRKTYDQILFRPSELTIWSGYNGHGKSQVLGQVILSAAHQGAKVCLASLEMTPIMLAERLTKQAGGLESPSREYVRTIRDWYQNKIWILDLLRTSNVDHVLELFAYANKRYGVEMFVIDSFMKLDVPEDDYKAQKTALEKLCDFKNQCGVHIHLVAHPRKGDDEYKPAGKMDIKGTGAIGDLADYIFSVYRNKAKERIRARMEGGEMLTTAESLRLNEPDTYLMCNKNRHGDNEDTTGLFFDKKSLQFLEYPTQKPFQYVNFSRIKGD